MKLKDIVEKSDKELEQLIAELQQQVGEAAIELRTKKVSNVKHIRNLKLSIARCLTIARQRVLTKEVTSG